MKLNHSFQINSLLKKICDRFQLFNFYLRKIVLQEMGGEIIFKRELIWNEWFIFIFIDIYNNSNNFKYIVLLFLNFPKQNLKWALTEVCGS